MIVVEKILAFETNENPCRIFSTTPPWESVFVDGGERAVSCEYLVDLVHGRWFGRPDGTSIAIGMSKQAQDVLGLQYEAWESMEKELDSLRRCLTTKNKQCLQSEKRLLAIQNATLWQRLKFLVKGEKAEK